MTKNVRSEVTTQLEIGIGCLFYWETYRTSLDVLLYGKSSAFQLIKRHFLILVMAKWPYGYLLISHTI